MSDRILRRHRDCKGTHFTSHRDMRSTYCERISAQSVTRIILRPLSALSLDEVNVATNGSVI